MRRTFAVSLTVAAAALSMACSPPTSPVGVTGSYVLESVNGLPLPYTLSIVGTSRLDVLDDLIILTVSSGYSEVGHTMSTKAGVVSLLVPVDAGTFQRRGDALTFESLLAGRWQGSVRNSTLTVVQQGLTLVYRK